MRTRDRVKLVFILLCLPARNALTLAAFGCLRRPRSVDRSLVAGDVLVNGPGSHNLNKIESLVRQTIPNVFATT